MPISGIHSFKLESLQKTRRGSLWLNPQVKLSRALGRTTDIRETMPTIRSFDSMLDVLLFSVIDSPLGAASAAALLREQKNLRAYKLTESVCNASIQLNLIGTAAGRQVALDATRLEALFTPLWIENTNSSTRSREAFLIEAQGEGTWAVSTYGESEQGRYAMAARVISLRREPDGSIRIQRGPTSRADGMQVHAVGEAVLARLAIISAPMLTEVVDDKPPKRGMRRFGRVRMVEPWADLHEQGIPKLGKTTRPAYVADEILDEFSILEGRIWLGTYQFETAAERSSTLWQMHQRRHGITTAMRFALSPLTAAAAAEVAESERAGMQQARNLVMLPDFLTWVEWRDAACGVPGQRFGLLLQATEDEAGPSDARGLLFALPADWTLNPQSFARMPMLAFDLRLKSVGLPLLEVDDVSPAMADAGEVDADRLGRFLLATLTFIGQPRMTEQVDVGRDPARQITDRARVARRLEPQVSIKEVQLVIDLPREVEDAAGDDGESWTLRGGVAPGGMPWHRVRMFWRWRLGRLEVVRPHSRGSVENGVSRRVTLLLHPSESTGYSARRKVLNDGARL